MAKHLLISEIFPPRTGGSGRWFWETYRRLPREEFVVAAGQCPGDEAYDRTHDLNVHRLPLTLKAWGLRSFAGLGGYWRAYRSLCKVARTEDISMVHCGRCLPEGVMALALKLAHAVPYLCYVHGEDVSTAACSREHAWLVRRVLRGARLLIANSHNTGRLLTAEWQVPAEKVHVIHPGVDTSYFVPASPDADFRAQYGWSDRPVLLTVGRLQKRKGQDMLIRALRIVRTRIPNVLYVIVGDGEESSALHALAQAEGHSQHVQFLGEPGDSTLLKCYQQCDLFLLPNRPEGKDIEGFGMVLLEAQACGKPVVAGASGGTRETMRASETGRIVDCTGPDELAKVVIELLSDVDLRLRMGQAGRRWVVDQFDWEVQTRKVRSLFTAQAPALVPLGATA